MKLKCPTCGAEDNDIREIPRFKVNLEGFEGVFCDACYIRWVTANIPKLVPVERQTEAPRPGGPPDAKLEERRDRAWSDLGNTLREGAEDGEGV